MKYKTIIVEDEKLGRDLVRTYCKAHDSLEIVGEYENGFDGLKAINELKPDLVFLDIQMPKLTGLEMLELIDDVPNIIFTTAYDEFAIKAFDMNAVDYLLKPFSQQRFSEAVDKALGRMGMATSESVKELKQQVAQEKVLDKIVVKSGAKITVLALADITYIESEDDYVMIHTSDSKHLKHQTMKFYESKLDPSVFQRIHRGYIVNVNHIARIEKYGKDTFQVVLHSGEKLHVSRSRYKELRESLNF